MDEFAKNNIQLLIATSVIEVGIDVPNATIMIIEGAERFGLSQLYQFRGRVGRSDKQSYCFLFTESESDKTKARLEAFISAKDSFDLAEKDLEMRGPGQAYGSAQSGFPEFKIADFFDLDAMRSAKECAEMLIGMNDDEHPELKKKISAVKRRIHME